MNGQNIKFANIEAERARNGLEYGELASLLDIERKTLYNYLYGVSPIPSTILVKMVSLFNCSSDYLLGLDSIKKNSATDESA